MALLSGLWNSIVGGNDKEADWNVVSLFYFDNKKKYFSVSEIDKEAVPIVYAEAHKITFNKTGFGLNYTPLSFVSIYYIDTRKAEVKMPSGHIDTPVIEDNRDGTVSIKYDPREEGVHELYVKYNGEHVQGSPYKFHVDSISSGYVTAYGPGLTAGVSGEPSQFTISTKGAGAGGLSMAVEGPSKAEITCHDNKDGTVAVSYLPTAPGEYKISVRFGDKHIKGSPFTAKVYNSITDSPLCRACMKTVETPIHVMLQCNGVSEQRAEYLGSSATLHEALGDLGGLLSFWSELGWLE
ncbi:jg14990 [Pararge aegeria aegeria]|uniref:Jg14990 protein n=1 Tax=Pararge aegeria aegeria TaxID=348720 RepID=A0A8S4QWS7_9NEOP|nr:jg14990 [Pararge aegeria aegeria]